MVASLLLRRYPNAEHVEGKSGMTSTEVPKYKTIAASIVSRFLHPIALPALGMPLVLLTIVIPARCADTNGFVKPTPEELAMTSVPGYPGVAAVVLYREVIAKDDLHEQLHYDRIKILTEEGKKYANVSLGYASFTEGYSGDEKRLDDIVGRTIHADGTIIPFTGKPFLKTLEKANDVTFHAMGFARDIEEGIKVQEKIFTLPEAEVGSIIEYRYATRENEEFYESPGWDIQGNLFIRSAYFAWYPTTRAGDESAGLSNVSWFSRLPPGVTVKRKVENAQVGSSGTFQVFFDVTMKDVPPLPHEEFLPPVESLMYMVSFQYTRFHSTADFWKTEGKEWFRTADTFAAQDGPLLKETRTITSEAVTDDQKLRKIYAAVMTIENTDFTRAHEKKENKDAGVGTVEHASDVLRLHRGSSRQIAELFAGMARAAGMKAYLMLVPDRSELQFNSEWLNFGQFSDLLVLVTVDGKERFFDPGSRYIPYGRIDWENTAVQGLRETDKGPEIVPTITDQCTDNKTGRVADLTMDEQGAVSGTVKLTFTGAPALHWRQLALRGDEESFRHDLRTSLEAMLPKSMDVNVTAVHGLEDYESPLQVTFTVQGTAATRTGKRLVLPIDLFLSEQPATFPEKERSAAVYFHYPQTVQDALLIRLPPGIAVEAAPDAAKYAYEDIGIYNMTIAPTANSITVHRNYLFNDALIPASKYAELRTFYSQFETRDHDGLVLKTTTKDASEAKIEGKN